MGEIPSIILITLRGDKMEKQEFEKLFKSTVEKSDKAWLHLNSKDGNFVVVDRAVYLSENKFYIYLKGGFIGLINCETVFAID
jgi:hypothetical protein